MVKADPGSVVDVIADVEAYPRWSSSIHAVTILSEDDLGWVDTARLTVDHTMFKDTYTLDYTWDIEEDGSGVVSWTLLEADVLTMMDGSYTLSEIQEDVTEVAYDLVFEVSIPMPVSVKRKVEETIIDNALSELKSHIEG